MRDEEIELDGLFVLLLDARPNELEAVGRLPGLGFPLSLEVAPLCCSSPPEAPCLDARFEIRKALEGNAHGIFTPRRRGCRRSHH
jgi:hypothetical protein